jgi:hypothetical protein
MRRERLSSSPTLRKISIVRCVTEAARGWNRRTAMVLDDERRQP